MDPLYIGIDAGGTKTAVLTSSTPAPFEGPGAQALRDGPEAVVETLVSLVERARREAGEAPLAGVAIGLAGAGRAETQAAVSSALRDRLGTDVALAVTHDADIALEAAWGEGSGALLLAGTGSLVYARTHEGANLRAGGWGGHLGDDGSGASLGRAALRALLAAFDGGPPTALVEIAAESYGVSSADDVVAAVYADRRPLAAFAPLLLDGARADDWVASSTLARETNSLGQQAGWLATRAGDALEHRLAYSGGLVGEDVYRTALEGALQRHLPGWAVSRSEAEPVEGALALARRLGG